MHTLQTKKALPTGNAFFIASVLFELRFISPFSRLKPQPLGG